MILIEFYLWYDNPGVSYNCYTREKSRKLIYYENLQVC